VDERDKGEVGGRGGNERGNYLSATCAWMAAHMIDVRDVLWQPATHHSGLGTLRSSSPRDISTLMIPSGWPGRVRIAEHVRSHGGGLIFKAHRLCVSLILFLRAMQRERERDHMKPRFPSSSWARFHWQSLHRAPAVYRDTSLMRNSTSPRDHHRALDICYCRVLVGRCFL